MRRLFVHVEGETEEAFVNALLRDHLIGGHGYAAVSARLLGKARMQSKRGGIRSWEVVKREIVRNLKEDRGILATTMVDYYGLPDSWPGRAAGAGLPFVERAEAVEGAIFADVASYIGERDARRFIPFVVMHEFEGLLFSEPVLLAEAIGIPDKASALQAMRDEFGTPEEMNDSPRTAPSKRLESIAPGYEKPLMGVLAARSIGLGRIRAACPHFDGWARRLEAA